MFFQYSELSATRSVLSSTINLRYTVIHLSLIHVHSQWNSSYTVQWTSLRVPKKVAAVGYCGEEGAHVDEEAEGANPYCSSG